MNEITGELLPVRKKRENTLVCLFKGILYIGLFELILNYVSLVMSISDSLSSFSDLSYIASVVSDLVIITVLVIMTAARRRSLCEEFYLKCISPAVAVTAFFTGLSLNLFIIRILNFFPGEVIEKYSGNQDSEPVNNLIAVIAVVIAAPIVEELVFRCFVLTRFKRGMSAAFAVILSAVCFGIVHLSIVSGIYAGMLGILLAVMFIRTGSVFTGILIHIGFNSFSFINSLFSGNGAVAGAYNVILVFLINASFVSSAVLITVLVLITEKKKNKAAAITNSSIII